MTINPNPTPIINPPQASKPRAYSTHTDRLPMVYREGSLDTVGLPSIQGNWRVWPDGRRERFTATSEVQNREP